MFPGQLKVPEHISDDIMTLEHLPSLPLHFEIILEIVKSRILALYGLQKGKYTKIEAKIMILVDFFKVVLGVI